MYAPLHTYSEFILSDVCSNFASKNKLIWNIQFSRDAKTRNAQEKSYKNNVEKVPAAGIPS